MRLLFFSHSLSTNSLGRTYVLWRLATLAGFESRIVCASGDTVWEPLKHTEFAKRCLVSPHTAPMVLEWATKSDLLVACKPLPTTLGAALEVANLVKRPLLLDIDDPDFEIRHSWRSPSRRIAREIFSRPFMVDLRDLRTIATRLETMVSNPWLQAIYGGELVPHAREVPDQIVGHGPVSPEPTIAFVGTVRRHKGVALLRHAVKQLRGIAPYRLVITSESPRVSYPWEDWIGTTPFQEGQLLVAKADLVVVPSSARGRGQLPAKVIDALIWGKPVIASDIPPLPWAVGAGGLTFRPNSRRDLQRVLLEAHSVKTREILGRAAGHRAKEEFSEAAVLPAFLRAVHAAAEAKQKRLWE